MKAQIATTFSNKQTVLKQVKPWMKSFILIIFILITSPMPVLASGGGGETLDMTGSLLGIFALILFVGAYSLVIFEEQLHLRKSKPVLLAAGLIWILVAIAFNCEGNSHAACIAIRYNLIEYAELFLFLLVAMTYINSVDERNVFQALTVEKDKK